MNQEQKIFKEFLQKKGLKLTKPRQIILEEVFLTHKHFNVDQLYDQIKIKYSNVSRATIYRTMPLLIEASLIKNALRCEAKDHYEHIYGHERHLHLICNKCGTIIEAEISDMEQLLNQIAETKKFHIEDYNVGARGVCVNCLKDGTNSNE
ncbi:MAG: transcriptional repressor [Candidatus Cloacimonetes bacterium]|nr:transcriptional repressor [Candidatus Cloacimonadota bacterium]